jgi:hypothetical protein
MEQNRDVVPFVHRCHGNGQGSLCQNGDSDYHFQIQGYGDREVNGEARLGLTSGRDNLEREIDKGDLSLCKSRGGRWAALVVVMLRGKGEGGSKLGGAWRGGRVSGPFIAVERRFLGRVVRTRSSCAFNGGTAGASVAE